MSQTNRKEEALRGLRTDLLVNPQTVRGESFVIIKEPEKGEYFRLSETEYLLAQAFDGQRTMRDAVEYISDEHDIEVEPKLLHKFHESLRSMGLLEKDASERHLMLLEKRREERKFKLLEMKGNLLFMRVPIWDPNDFFDKVIPYIRWIWSPPAVIASLLIMLLASAIVVQNWQEVLAGAKAIYSFQGNTAYTALILYATVLGVIGIHELGHGLTCKRFGGEVHEIGFLFMLLMPCMFANVNDAYMFSERKHRLYVTAAGVYIEFLIGSLAVFIWYFTAPQTWINSISYQAMAVCGLSTALFNFNPLMKLDGYHALCDILELPNLKANSGDYVGYWVKTRILGCAEDEQLEFLPERTKKIYLIYGSLSTLYMTCMLSTMFFVIGMLLTSMLGAVGYVLWGLLGYFICTKFLKSTFLFIRDYLLERKHLVEKMKWLAQRGTIGALGLSAVTLLFGWTTKQVEGECEVLYADKSVLNAAVDGRVVDARYTPAHQVLVRLENLELEEKKERLEMDIKRKEMQLLSAQDDERMNEVRRLEGEIAGLRAEQKVVSEDLGQLELLSTIPGTASVEDLDSLIGKQVRKGEEILTVYDTRVVKALLDVDDYAITDVRVGQTVKFLAASPWVDDLFYGEVEEIYEVAIEDGAKTIYQVGIRLSNDGSVALRQGQAGTARIDVGTQPLHSLLTDFWYTGVSPDIKLLVNNLWGTS